MTSAAKNLYIKTYGCQMNVYDSLRIQDLMQTLNYKLTENLEEADMIVLNTCHIREKASEKMYSELGRINKIKEHKKRIYNTKVIIAIAGCVGQAEGDEIFKRAPFVDIIVGPQSYHHLPDFVLRTLRDEKHLIELDFIEEEKFDKLPETLSPQGPAAFLSIQEGCDKFCTFCVVPYTRGAEFSRPVEQIYREALTISSQGAKEITLLGQNVNAYHGVDENGNKFSLARLISMISKIDNIQRIRYTTSHPLDMTDDLIALHGQEPKLMPFLHLPVQSGSNNILKSMNRKHTRELYLEVIDKLRAHCPDLAISSDWIIGFPEETDKDFEDTLDLVKRVGFAHSYSFKYSPRPGTPAASKKQVPEKIKDERLQILQKELSKQELEFNQSFVGKTLEVLFHKKGKLENQVVGKTQYMQSLYVTGKPEELRGKIALVKVTEAFQTSLSGIIISEAQ